GAATGQAPNSPIKGLTQEGPVGHGRETIMVRSSKPDSPPQRQEGSTFTGFAVPPTPASRRKPRVLAPIRLGGESTIFVECRRDMVVVYRGRRWVPIDALNHSPAYNRLLKAVSDQAERLQGLARPEQPARLHIRFLVHPHSEQTLHLAYPVLEKLGVPMTR